MQRKLKLFSVIGVLMLVLAACGSGGTTTTAPTTAPAAGGETAPTAAPAPAANTSGVANCAVAGPKVEKLTFWTRALEGDANGEFASLRAVADAYTAAIGTPVELVTVPDADFKAKMSISAPAGEGPDVYGPIAHDWIGEFAIQQIALEVPASAIKEQDDIIPATLDAARIDGKLYGMPLFVESVALIYNKALVPTPPTTWDEFVKIATEQTQGDVYGFGFPILEQYHSGAFFMGFGGYIFNYQNGAFNVEDIGLNNEGSVAAAKFLRDMYHSGTPKLPEVAIDRANMHAVQEGMMEAGQIAMTINGPWREGALKSAGIDYGIAKLPTLPNGEPMRPFLGVQVLGANAFSANKEAALDFLSFATCTTSSLTMQKAFNKVPVRTSAAESEELKANPNIAIWSSQAADGIPMPNIPAMSNVWKPWGDAMDAIIPGNAPDDQVQTLLDGAVEQIKTAIEQTK
jgi:arabinogalactan oligomer / maltooligosaccharide transport system substrate-binding protein